MNGFQYCLISLSPRTISTLTDCVDIMFIKEMNLEQITVVVQDWGGLIGLAVAADMPERFARLVIMNTGLPTGKGKPSEAFLAWRNFVESHPDVPIGQSMLRGLAHPETHTNEATPVYEAPFPDV